jgi:eukaryotic translation initiation factor 2C
MDLSWKTTPIVRRVAAQINTKLGGIPWGVDIPLKGLMTVGVDVMVNPFIKTTKVFALVASMNNQYTCFYSGSNIYYSFEDLANQVCHQLNLAVKNYQKHNEGKFPKYIVLYRDGVAKKHAEKVCENEVQLIKVTYVVICTVMLIKNGTVPFHHVR